MPYKDINDKRNYQSGWIRKRRREWINKNGPCVCGSGEKLEIDHIDSTQKITHRVWSWSDKRREKELAKCQVLCHNCHVKKTGKEIYNGGALCGKRSKYKKGCRCDLCKEAQQVYCSEWRERN